jgi:hypothetical protein
LAFTWRRASACVKVADNVHNKSGPISMHIFIATAMKLLYIVVWLNEVPLAKTRLALLFD